MTYEEYKNKKQEEVNKLPLFFAYNDVQFEDAMKERGLKPTDTDKIYSLPNCGGFYLKTDADKIKEFFNRKDELPELMKDEEFAEGAFYYEMADHEYAINWEGDYDVCECFGECKYRDDKSGDDYLKEMGYGETTRRAYQKARKRYMKGAMKNDWF